MLAKLIDMPGCPTRNCKDSSCRTLDMENSGHTARLMED